MLLFHQTGHNYIWNLSSFIEDNTGEGLIFSPVNIPSKKIDDISIDIKTSSYFDPQFYLINQPKSKLSTYNYFPANIKNDFKTEDLIKSAYAIAKNCLSFQLENDFKYLVIPARYFDQFPTRYYEQFQEFIISPFLDCIKKMRGNKKVLLTLIIKPTQMVDEEAIASIMNWITSIPDISGVYLFFENKFQSKQIKDANYLYNALLFIHFLKMNQLEVHIGYNNTEGFLYSVANPDSISMGSYDNLRSFNINRFEIKLSNKQKAPRARLYIGNLLQWIDYGYLRLITQRYKKFVDIFEDSRYKPLMFVPEYNWHFQKPEPYKHYFLIFSKQIKILPDQLDERIRYVESKIDSAIEYFNEIKDSGILLDDDSDGSHLIFWKNSITMFKEYKNDHKQEFLQ